MKKILMVALCLMLVPMLYASQTNLKRAELDADVAPGLRTTAERMIQVCPTPDRAIKPTPTRTSRQEDTLYYDNMSNVNSIGMNTTGYHWSAAVRFTTTELAPYAGYNLIAVVVYRAAFTTTNDSIIVYGQGTPILPGPVVSAQAWTPTTATWNRFDLPTPVAINGTDDIWIADAHTESPGGFPSGVGPGPYVVGKGSWVNDSGAWYELGPLGLDYNWNIWAIVEPGGGPAGLVFDFEDGLQGWTHTNGQPFPAGWDVEPSGYYTNLPDEGDSSMQIDSDGGGSAFWIQDSALSPLLVPNPTMDWLKYGYYNDGGGGSWLNELHVGIKYFTGGVWSAAELAFYPSGVASGPGWDSVDVSAYATADQIQIYFYFDDLDTWGYWAVFDNVSIDAHYPVAGPVVWDFETGWQGWIHTNGQPFPVGWDVLSSGYQPSYTPPDAGDSTLWIDSDAAGSGGPWVQDTVLSPAVVPNFSWLKWGIGYLHLGSQFMDVGIKYFDGATWTAVPLRTYNATFGPAWDSVDISAYNGYDSIQVYGYFDDANGWNWYAGFDNVGLYPAADHDVGCTEVVSPSAGAVPAADYDVIGRIQNFGADIETFDVTADVFDTVGMVNVFSQTVTLTDFPVAGDSNVNFGTVTFAQDSAYYTEIYTQLVGDINPLNDTSAILSWTGMSPGEIVFELDAEAITGDIRLLGVEFDGEYFYVTGATDMTQTKVYVIDTAGTLMHSYNQPAHSTSWGWRDIAWDYTYRGPDRIDTLYSSVNNNVDKWSYDFVGDSLIYHGFFPGPENPNRALAYDGDDDWFFTANFSSNCYKFNKDTVNIQSVANTYAMYGAAYDYAEGWLWWHSQDDLGGTGYLLTIHQMDPVTMAFTGYFLAPVPTMSTTGTAGGLSFWSDFRGMDVLFGMNQGTPDHIFGVYLRSTGIEEMPGVGTPLVFGFASNMANPIRGHTAIVYTTTTSSKVSLKVYDTAGRLVRTLVNAQQPAGMKNIIWNAKDDNHRAVANGIYFIRLESVNQYATHKLVLVK